MALCSASSTTSYPLAGFGLVAPDAARGLLFPADSLPEWVPLEELKVVADWPKPI